MFQLRLLVSIIFKIKVSLKIEKQQVDISAIYAGSVKRAFSSNAAIMPTSPTIVIAHAFGQRFSKAPQQLLEKTEPLPLASV
ncbi:MAG: hypothetical protein PUP46_04705 [Endozoicomonas sp. (ex Botrylloides leachii)]|nr:hypothetical protein [Endozoicomonas sp. (ex Botrylloides leachii)]